jgi:hypothetical protein
MFVPATTLEVVAVVPTETTPPAVVAVIGATPFTAVIPDGEKAGYIPPPGTKDILCY